LQWYTAPVGGTQLSPNGIYTTPNLTSNQTYYVQATSAVTAGGGVGSVLITECGLQGFAPGADNDYVEISNLYNTSINTAGWRVAVSNSYTNINLVNGTIWTLPASFAPCSILSKTDVTGSANYWGSNILWNPNNAGWAIIIDNAGNVVDFVAWGWTAAQLASFNVTIAGFPITLGAQWAGASCSSACTVVAGTPYSISRTGGTDNNNAGDFNCQATSLNLLNPGLPCGWVANSMTCPFPTTVTVDQVPTATNPNPMTFECLADVPAPDVLVVDDEADDYTIPPAVSYIGQVSNGQTCSEILTRTYRVTDGCNAYVDVTQTITIDDVTPPAMDPAPSDVTVQCAADIPAMISLDWTDNCDGSGSVSGTDVSNGLSCPETITRTWTYSDACGNATTRTQLITIHDTQNPSLPAAPADATVQCYADVPNMISMTWTDNCDGTGNLSGVEVSSGTTCPETLTRTWTYSDGCGNTETRTQVITVMDDTPPVLPAAPADMLVQCYADVPPMLGMTWTDNCDGTGYLPGVEVSSGTTCPEILTRTWTYTDGCGNTTTRVQSITVHDTQEPVIASIPTSMAVQCPADVPVMPSISWTDNCAGGGMLAGVQGTSGTSCPEILTRTWTYTDACGNTSTKTQTITIDDTQYPTASDLPTIQVAVLPAPDPNVITDEADNCSTPLVQFVSDVSNNELCPEKVIRTYSVTDDCDNEIFVTQEFIVGDPFPDAAISASQTEFSIIDEVLVQFTNHTTGAVSYVWDFGDLSVHSNEFSPEHLFPNTEPGNYLVEMIGISEFGCMDTAWVWIYVKDELLVFIPNSFTPDDDEFNQHFQPIFTSGFDPFNFHMVVYNRWGEVLFESYDASKGWDGTYHGELVPEGTYTWKIQFQREDSSDREVMTGHISLIR
jgi:gliding motility-associated-like protein